MTSNGPAVFSGSVQSSSVAQSCPTLCNPMDCSMPGFPVHHQLPEFTQTHVPWVGVAIQPCHPLPSPSPAFNLSQHQSFLMNWLFTSCGQSIGVSASASVLPVNIQDWHPLGWLSGYHLWNPGRAQWDFLLSRSTLLRFLPNFGFSSRVLHSCFRYFVQSLQLLSVGWLVACFIQATHELLKGELSLLGFLNKEGVEDDCYTIHPPSNKTTLPCSLLQFWILA